ncbi:MULTISPECIES: hypothetical protein [Mycobacterium]|uniref:Uncharacterized protein n=1 Tax=Mycobacterium paraffinicum TaxID=53378 RepID=A0ABP8F3N9_9MYCO|nr:hypothetical protein [Mycobacterium avium]QLK92803.1 hypothetical protein BEP52_24795 [Mycobacterium avium subsp. hominissuis]QWY63759.1 hypothetical protein BJP74_24630 [Mycobacterium avium subsp. hominissuis]QWY65017.1 hypothetical protein BJP78_25505 [Mycobacterium avium subsp. hominissuis]BAN91957.1 Aspartate/tyrosine/aromatic aminotransferase [Mycobacterium avium subsp. hominissuis TH135]
MDPLPSSSSAAPPHFCHARGCDTEIEPRLFMCADHWALVPPALRESIRSTYRPGQEVDKQPSEQYLAFAAAAIADVAHKEGRRRRPGLRTPTKPVQLALFDISSAAT